MPKIYGYAAANTPMIPYNANSPAAEVVAEPLKRFECSSPSGGKFWEVSIVEGTHYGSKVYNLKVTYGKLGTVGKTSLHRFNYLKGAKTAMARKINEKVNKGYFEAFFPSFKIKSPFSAATTKGAKELISNMAQVLKDSLPVGCEVIVTVIAGNDIIQESVK